MEQTIISTKDNTYTGKVTKNCWLTPEITAILDKLITEKWFIREVIYPKEVPGCEIFDYNGCMRLYHKIDRFFAFDGERINSEAGKYCNLNVDFFSAERITIQKPDKKAFDRWNNGECIELTSLWPERQMIIAARHDTKQMIAFAPIFVVYTPQFYLTKDMERSYDFEREFRCYKNHTEKSLGQGASSETLAFLRNSYNLLLWLKNHCY